MSDRVLTYHGSSPRMRGAHICSMDKSMIKRIIPADAGSTFTRLSRAGLQADHPRGCGEHVTARLTHEKVGGSSPRMRGALLAHLLHLRPLRIIPADAGSTNKPVFWTVFDEDHPRGCGEHSFAPLRMSCRAGSSPRMRGAHPGQAAEESDVGIIPADAGSTGQLLA